MKQVKKIYLSKGEARAVADMCDKLGISFSEFARKAIEERVAGESLLVQAREQEMQIREAIDQLVAVQEKLTGEQVIEQMTGLVAHLREEISDEMNKRFEQLTQGQENFISEVLDRNAMQFEQVIARNDDLMRNFLQALTLHFLGKKEIGSQEKERKAQTIEDDFDDALAVPNPTRRKTGNHTDSDWDLPKAVPGPNY